MAKQSTTSPQLKAEFHRGHSFLFVTERQGADAAFDDVSNPHQFSTPEFRMWHYGNRLAKDWIASMDSARSEWSLLMDRVRGADLHV